MTKKALLISCFDWYKKRLEPIRELLLQQKGYNQKEYDEVKVLLADFDHFKKEPIETKYPECTYIPVPKYKGNMSIRRIYSHLSFGWKVRKYLRTEQPDLVYCLVPPNNVGFQCARYKKKRPETKLILDIIDLWPESIPYRTSPCSTYSTYSTSKPSSKSSSLNFSLKIYSSLMRRIIQMLIKPFWKKMRNDCIKVADHIFTECDFYKEKLNLPAEKTSTLYLFKKQTEEEEALVRKIIQEKTQQQWQQEQQGHKIVKFAYLGSMNHIIDIEGICSVIKQFVDSGYTCQLHAIGDGEKRREFEKAVMETGCLTYFYGPVFDEKKKIETLAPCDYGLNMMKNDVEVGLSTKSIDYLSYGLPLINNIKGDTWKLIERESLGVNTYGFNTSNKKSNSDAISNNKGDNVEEFFSKTTHRSDVKNAYTKHFVIDAFKENANFVLSEIYVEM